MFPNQQALPGEFAQALAREGHRFPPLAAFVFWYPEIGSTNDRAAALADRGADEGCLVLADAQTAGRGRLGRTWASPPGAGVYASVILRPAADVTPLVTLAAGVAIAEGIEAATGLAPRLKWPNDVFLESSGRPGSGRKLAGILAEGGSTPDGRSWVVLGFGINVLPAAYPPDVAARATSLEAELGRAVDRGVVLAECLAALSKRYRDLGVGRAETIVSAWRSRASSTFGRRVEWDADGRSHRGIARDIEPSGALVVSTDAGVRRVISGEVRWI